MSQEVEFSNADAVAVDPNIVPVKLAEEDYPALQEIQFLVDNLAKYRQELGRLFQLISNIRDDANKIEMDLSSKRQSLASKYDLANRGGSGQWALDFEEKEFVKTSSKSPIIP
jgi:hypothetical protein